MQLKIHAFRLIKDILSSRKIPTACTYYLLVLVVDERGSFSAIDAHIFPCLVQTVLEDVD